MAIGAEVRAQPRPQVTRAADVQHLVETVTEEVDPRYGRGAERQRALLVHAARARRGELAQVGDGRRSTLLGEADQPEQHLGRRLRVGQRAVARADRGAEEVRERGEARAGDAATENAARERDGVDHGRREPRPGQALRLAVEEGEVEARVVRHEDGVSGEGEEAAHRGADRRGSPELRVAQPCERRDDAVERDARVRERLELLRQLETAYAHGADLADPRRPGTKARRLEVDDHVRRRLEEKVVAEWLREADAVAVPGETRVASDDVVEQAARKPGGDVPKREEPPCGLLGIDRTAPLLDELDEPVGGIDPQLHGREPSEHVFDRQGSRRLGPWTASARSRWQLCAPSPATTLSA